MIDQLDWKSFYKESKKQKGHPKEVKPFNRLIAHTENFFLISGYGAFTKGYSIIISKEFISSFGLIKDDQIEEVNFLINLVKEIIQIKYNRPSVIFEHGMCACLGGLDRAHLHVMSVDPDTTKSNLINAINKTLDNRKSGIKYIKYKNFKLENLHDINHFFENYDKKKFKIFGKLKKLKDLKNLDFNKWPSITRSSILKGKSYIYFKSDFYDSSFLTTTNFSTQFGREVVFQNEMKKSKLFMKKVKLLKKNNEFFEIWKWQNEKFDDYILKTIIDFKSQLVEFQNKKQNEFKKYKLEIS